MISVILKWYPAAAVPGLEPRAGTSHLLKTFWRWFLAHWGPGKKVNKKIVLCRVWWCNPNYLGG